MIELHCPRCNALLQLPDTAAGLIVPCPSCNADVPAPVTASAQVIDVRAEGLNDPEPPPEDYENDPFFNPANQQPFSGQAWGRTIRVQRTGDGSGCCLLGCLGITFFIILAIRGFVSLF